MDVIMYILAYLSQVLLLILAYKQKALYIFLASGISGFAVGAMEFDMSILIPLMIIQAIITILAFVPFIGLLSMMLQSDDSNNGEEN